MQQRQPQPQQEQTQVDVAAVERDSHTVTNESLFAAAMFAKQLQHDINGIKSRSLGDLKVTDVDMSQIMPSNILKTFKGVNINTQPPPQPIRQPLPPNVVNLPYIEPVPLPPVPQQVDSGQFEFDFDKKVRYEDIMEAIEKLDNKITILTNKFNELTTAVDKKKLKKAQDNGTQTG